MESGSRGRFGRGIRGPEIRDRKANRVLVDPGTAMVTVGFDELRDVDDDIQGHSQQEMVHLRVDMVIEQVKQKKATRRA